MKQLAYKNSGLLALALAMVGVGCTAPTEAPGAAGDAQDASFLGSGGKADEFGIEEGSPEANAILAFANEAGFEELDVEVGLDIRAAQNIVDRRPFESLAELDAVPWLGPVAFERLLEYVLQNDPGLALDSVDVFSQDLCTQGGGDLFAYLDPRTGETEREGDTSKYIRVVLEERWCAQHDWASCSEWEELPLESAPEALMPLGNKITLGELTGVRIDWSGQSSYWFVVGHKGEDRERYAGENTISFSAVLGAQYRPKSVGYGRYAGRERIRLSAECLSYQLTSSEEYAYRSTLRRQRLGIYVDFAAMENATR